MDLDARPLRYFVAVAELNSFSRAALSMGVSQPALSAAIKELERRLGFALFDRGSRHVLLTSEGKTFLGNARRYVRENDILRQSWHDIESNDVRLNAAFYTALIPERNALIERFLVEKAKVNIHVTNDEQEKGLSKLSRHDIDLQIALDAGNPLEEANFSTSQGDYCVALKRIIVASRPIQLLVPVEHSLAGRHRLALEDMRGFEIVVPSRHHGVAISEQIRFALASAGALLIRSPEGNAIGVELYAAVRRLPAISLGWFSNMAAERQMLPRPVEGFGMTHLSLIRTTAKLRPAADELWRWTHAYADSLIPS